MELTDVDTRKDGVLTRNKSASRDIISMKKIGNRMDQMYKRIQVASVVRHQQNIHNDMLEYLDVFWSYFSSFRCTRK